MVEGVVNKSPVIRIIGGKGKDEMIDLSSVKGNFLPLLPFNKVKNKTFFYDAGKKTVVVKSSGTSINKQKIPKPRNISEKYEPLQQNRGSEMSVYPLIGYNSDDGLIFGFGSFLNKYAFRQVPFKYKLSLSGSYTTKSQHADFQLSGIFNAFIEG